MKAIRSNIPRALNSGARVDCVDNTGAKVLEIISVKNYRGVKNRYPKAGVGDLCIVSVKKGTPEMRKQVLLAVVVRQKKEIRRPDGLHVSFEDNAMVLVDDSGVPKGTDIKGPVAREVAERFPKVGTTASIVI
ncbi:50S ribosomal protein L14 [Methanolapillus millepedarum]|uniref:Large ribosomal subunit protein uL14 n=1 Tax=Methanolapillus millepedarum TaxID=3028296 RepID=A0AA96V5R8_9EURY|nr:50S ribosomal protein L14 [Methanosarcinaceae archaeon Ac7]